MKRTVREEEVPTAQPDEDGVGLDWIGPRRLASARARRQSHQIWAGAGGALLLLLAFGLGIWASRLNWVTELFPQTVAWCLLPFGFSTYLMYGSAHLPAAERRIAFLLNMAVPFALLILGFALFHHAYSRSAMLLVVLMQGVWLYAVEGLWGARDRLRLLLLQEQSKDQLRAQLGEEEQATRWMDQIDWVDWPPTEPVPFVDGALVSRVESLQTEALERLAALKWLHVRLYSPEAVAESLNGRVSLDLMVNPLWQPDGHPAYDALKRLMDVAVVLALAPVWLPVCMVVALAVRLDSPGPALFSQMRIGLHGRPFRIWKFRTMVVQDDGAQAQFAQLGDRRVTRLGQFLRKSRLDEVPQLANVLVGHMSLIGPRPEQQAFVKEFAVSIPSYPYRHLVRPGLTGWAQVCQGYAADEASTTVKLSYDLYYVKHYSLALDLLIVAKTIHTVLTGFGAR